MTDIWILDIDIKEGRVVNIASIGLVLLGRSTA